MYVPHREDIHEIDLAISDSAKWTEEQEPDPAGQLCISPAHLQDFRIERNMMRAILQLSWVVNDPEDGGADLMTVDVIARFPAQRNTIGDTLTPHRPIKQNFPPGWGLASGPDMAAGAFAYEVFRDVFISSPAAAHMLATKEIHIGEGRGDQRHPNQDAWTHAGERVGPRSLGVPWREIYRFRTIHPVIIWHHIRETWPHPRCGRILAGIFTLENYSYCQCGLRNARCGDGQICALRRWRTPARPDLEESN